MRDLDSLVAGGEDDQATHHRAHLLTVLVQAGVLVKVIDRFHVRIGRLRLRVREAPAAVDQHGAVVGRVHEGRFRLGRVLHVVQGLRDHQPDAGVGASVAAGHTAAAETVVVDGRDRTGHVRAVVAHGDLAEGRRAVGGHEAVAVDIVDVAVVVVILSGIAVQLGLVDPHVLVEVFVVEIRALVVDGHDHLRLAGLDLPGVEGVHVAAFRPLRLSAGILVMPLDREVRIVKRILQLHTADLGHEFHDRDLLQIGDGVARPGQRQAAVEVDVIPEVQAGGAVARLPFPCGRESTGHRIVAQGGQVQPLGLGPDKRGFFLEFDPDDAGHGAGRHFDGRFGRFPDGGPGLGLAGAGEGQQDSREE